MKWQIIPVLAAGFLVGCGTIQSAADRNAEYQLLQDEIAAREAVVAEREAALTAREVQLAKIESNLRGSAPSVLIKPQPATSTQRATASTPATTQALRVPANATPSQCFGLVYEPPKFSPAPEKVLVREAADRFEITQPRYEWIERRVLIAERPKDPNYPVEYVWTEEKIQMQPERRQPAPTAAAFKTTQKAITAKPQHRAWQACGSNATSASPFCFKAIDAKQRQIPVEVLETGAKIDWKTTPAKHQTLRVRRVVQPDSGPRIPVVAEYKTLRVQQLVKPASFKRVPVAAQYKTVNVQQKTADARVTWREIVCGRNLSTAWVKTLQTELKKRGLPIQHIDGLAQRETFNALTLFQKQQKLAVSRPSISLETVTALGLKAPKK